TLEDDSGGAARALALSSSLIQLERTDAARGESAMDLRLEDVEGWETRDSTTERACLLVPVLVALSWEAVSEEVASMSVTVGAVNLDFSYQDLILTHAVAMHWLGVWGNNKKETGDVGAVQPPDIVRPRQLSQPPLPLPLT